MSIMASPSERGIRDALVRYSNLVYDKGWVANHDGNLTAWSRRGRIVATPTGTSKGDVDTSNLLVVDESGERIAGRSRAFSELALHLAVYSAREDVRAVVHAHPPNATAMACAGVALDRPFMPEAVVSLGPVVPLVPFAAPGTPAFTEVLTPYLPQFDVVMLENHGVLSWGDTVEQAFLRMELVEHLARMASNARVWGGVQYLDAEVVDALVAKRTRAGLGPEARGEDPVRWNTTGPTASPNTPPAHRRRSASRDQPSELDRETLARVITEEIGALMRDGS